MGIANIKKQNYIMETVGKNLWLLLCLTFD